MRSRAPALETKTPESDSVRMWDQYVGTPPTLKYGDGKRRPLLKSHISHPEVISGVDNWNSRPNYNTEGPLPPGTSNNRRPSFLRNVSRSDAVQLALQTTDGPKLKCQLGNPRLSPMEYTRLFLIEKAMSEREKRVCELPKPAQTRYWTPRWEKFLIIPHIPSCIRRDLTPMAVSSVEPPRPDTELEHLSSDTESVVTLKPESQSMDYPRLSLHLGDMPVLLPSFIDVACSNMNNETTLRTADRCNEQSLEVSGDDHAGLKLASSQQTGKGLSSPYGVHLELIPKVTYGQLGEIDEPRHEEITEFLGRCTSIQSLEDCNKDEDSDTTMRDMSFQQPINSQALGSFFIKQPDEDILNCSPKSQRSVETAIFKRQAETGSVQVQSNVEDVTLSPQASHLGARSLSPLDYVTPGGKHRGFKHDIHSLEPIDTRSPLARFPISAQPTHRLTPGTLARRVIGAAGGSLQAEDAHQPQLIQSLSSELPQGLTADFWDVEKGSMISDFQPEPLKIPQRESQATVEHYRKWSMIFDGLSGDVPSTLKSFELNLGPEHGFGPSKNEPGEVVLLDREQTIRRLKRQIRNCTDSDVSPAPTGLHRSSSTIVTPTQSLKSLQRKASFNLEQMEHSGFTPEYHGEKVAEGSFPRSGMMLSLRDTQTRLRLPLEEPKDIQLSRSLDTAPPMMRRLPDVPDSHQQRAAPRTWEKAVTATPGRAKRFTHWSNDRFENYDASSCLTDISGTSTQKPNRSTEGDVQRYPSTTTRDFSQTKLKKQRPKHKPVPVDAHRFSTQRYTTSGRVPSPIPFGEDPIPYERNSPSPTESRNTVVLRTPSSTIGSLFRKRVRSEHSAPTTPRTPASPSMHWRPFDEPEPEPPCSSPWASGQGEDRTEKAIRAEYFRAKAKYEIEGKQSPKRSSRKGSFGSSKSKEDIRRRNLGLSHRQSMESLVGWKSFIDDAPEPLFSSPLPPVPPLPTASQLNLTLNRLPQAQASLWSAPAAAYRAKKPQGLKVETQKLRKASRDGLRGTRAPSSATTTMTPVSGSSAGGLRTAFRLDGTRTSSGRALVEEEELLRRGREYEVVSRRR
ncbi:hypothetical protein FZEAL_10864 [Fusarium zealandicum]|uniref:Uncharacterized protein n=1 Tax=Fusarium zealandicum TaxID=1053134 RepID=A0A8H4TUY5_9HYPO|nr:hypothetical protein FZEAL_10864 [Fusarium zealandicum]